MIGLDRIKSLSESIVRDNVESHLDSVIELLPSTAQPSDHCTYFIHSRRRGCSYSKPNLLQNCSLYNYLSFSGVVSPFTFGSHSSYGVMALYTYHVTNCVALVVWHGYQQIVRGRSGEITAHCPYRNGFKVWTGLGNIMILHGV